MLGKVLILNVILVMSANRHDNNKSYPHCRSTLQTNSLTCHGLVLSRRATLPLPDDLFGLNLVNVTGVMDLNTFGNSTSLNTLKIARSRLDIATLPSLPHLHFLVFKENFDFGNVSRDLFNTVTNISWLSFVSNNNSIFHDDCLSDLGNLTWLHIQNETFPQLSSDFLRNSFDLHELTITLCNLSEIDPQAFDSNGNLEILSLNFNKLRSLGSGTFKNLRKLRFLELHHNHFTNLDLGQFAELKSLEIVGFPSNILRNLNGSFTDLITTFPNLKKMEIRRTDVKKHRIATLIKELKKHNIGVLGTPHDCHFPHPPYHSCHYHELAIVPPLTTHN